MTQLTKWIGGSALALGLAGSALWWTGSGSTSGDTPPAVYVCRETGALFIGLGQSAPQVHPETGRPSLYPGLYCRHCRQWKPAPPLDRLYGHPELLNCPSCKIRRTFDGDVPEGARKL